MSIGGRDGGAAIILTLCGFADNYIDRLHGGTSHHRAHHRGQGVAGMYNSVQVTPSRCPADIKICSGEPIIKVCSGRAASMIFDRCLHVWQDGKTLTSLMMRFSSYMRSVLQYAVVQMMSPGRECEAGCQGRVLPADLVLTTLVFHIQHSDAPLPCMSYRRTVIMFRDPSYGVRLARLHFSYVALTRV